VFKITPGGTLTTLYSFCSPDTYPNCPDGTGPFAGLVQAANGDFYGTTFYGGNFSPDAAPHGGGTIFKITASGALTTLYAFCSQSLCTDGANPFAGLVQATDGNLYGAASKGGAYGQGTIFEIAPSPSDTLTTLYSFCSQGVYPDCTDGAVPGALVQGTNGTFYGATVYGGVDAPNSYCAYIAYECGTVFSLSTGLAPFVETQPTSGKAGTVVTILGTDLTGASSISFNGVPAVFGVSSRPGNVTAIATVVPAGASTGTVEVVTPNGTLSSNVPFRVP
jgi:uncharacterized repeat protein (TIGR03803 family)